MPLAVDNSVVLGWYVENQATPYTQAIAEQLLEDRACAPALWELELTSVLRTACLRQRMTAEKAQQVLTRIAMLPIDVDRRSVPRRWRRGWGWVASARWREGDET